MQNRYQPEGKTYFNRPDKTAGTEYFDAWIREIEN